MRRRSLIMRLAVAALAGVVQVVLGVHGHAVAPRTVVLRNLPAVDPTRDPPRKWVLTHHRFVQPNRSLPPAAPAPEEATPQMGPSPAPHLQFSSFESHYGVPPDTQGAVGPDHVMVVANGFLVIHTRSGAMEHTVPLDGLFDVKHPRWAADPTLQYDPWRKRWIATAMISGPGKLQREWMVATTMSADATDAWKIHHLDYPASVPKANIDQPRAAVTENGLLLCADVYDDNGWVGGWLLMVDPDALSKAEAIQAKAKWTSGSMAPAVVPPGEKDQALFMSWSSPKQTLYRYKLDANGEPQVNDTVAVQGFPWSTDGPTEWPQAGSLYKLDARGYRGQRGLIRNGWSWWTAQVSTGAGSAPAVAWFAVDDKGVIAASGVVGGDDDEVARVYPSLAVSEAGAVLLGYTRLAKNGYASAAYSWRSPTDPNGTMRQERVFFAGKAPYEQGCGQDGVCRWGDYSATAIDPLQPDWLWTFQEYAAKPMSGDSRHGIAVATVRPPCGKFECNVCERCEQAICVAAFNGLPCNDGSACTEQDACLGDKCKGSPITCPPAGPCLATTGCDPQNGECQYTAAHEGGPCDDGSLCTSGDQCTAGGCLGVPKLCKAKDQCHTAYCAWKTGACETRPIDTPFCREGTPTRLASAGCHTGAASRLATWLCSLLVCGWLCRNRRQT